MKTNILLIICSLTLMVCACKKKENTSLSSGIHPDNFDTTARPQDDFYQYACGGWMKNHPLSEEYSRFGSFDQLGEDNLQQLHTLIEDLAKQNSEQGSVAQKIGDLYNLGMDSARLEREGAQPLQSPLKRIADIRDLKGIGPEAARLSLIASSPFLSIFGEADPRNSDRRIAWIWQSGLGIGDRDYYLDKEFEAIRQSYADMLAKLLELSGYSRLGNFAGKEKNMAAEVLKLETRMAKAFMSKEDCREPEKTVHIAPFSEIAQLLPAMEIPQYIDILQIRPDSINIGMPDYFKELNNILKTTDIQVLKAYLACNLVRSASAYLSMDFYTTQFDFYGKLLSGKEEPSARWKRVVRTINGSLGEAVGQMYVKQYFPESAKERMSHLVALLQESLGERIQQAAWMSDSTKKAALTKLDAFHVKIGYPDKWRDYSALQIKQGNSYWENIAATSEFESRYELAKIGKPIDKDEWLMSPQTVNAYYNPTTNEICFPAGILQPPFFDMHADDAVNYGAIGVVIGHEMTHGFDDQGCKYDAKGNLHNWWTAEDAANFGKKTQVLVDWFNGIEVLPGVHANGQFTLGENIADNGGLNIAFSALQKAKANGEIQEIMDGFSADQRFFIAYAMVWAGNIRDKEIVRRTKEDPHSLGRWRVNGTLPHISPFAQAFGLKAGDGMYLAPEKRALIW